MMQAAAQIDGPNRCTSCPRLLPSGGCQVIRPPNGILGFGLAPVFVGVPFFALPRFVDLIGTRRDSLMVDLMCEAAGTHIGRSGSYWRVTGRAPQATILAIHRSSSARERVSTPSTRTRTSS
ncbi:MAG: hypothetical protein ACREUZ_18630 [Burkholderiales bacterium]